MKRHNHCVSSYLFVFSNESTVTTITLSELFQNKFRTVSMRLQSWNYANAASYFVTICTKNREHYFGEIKDGKMQLSEIGKIAHSEWFHTAQIRPDMKITLGEFVIMPDHIHGIITIGENKFNVGPIDSTCRDAMHCVSTGVTGGLFAPQTKNLAALIRGYKSAVTTYARKNQIEFNWQARYYDYIIRSSKDFNTISEYIRLNPEKWQKE